MDVGSATSAATGMGIISSALFTFLSPGDRVVSVMAPLCQDLRAVLDKLDRDTAPSHG